MPRDPRASAEAAVVLLWPAVRKGWPRRELWLLLGRVKAVCRLDSCRPLLCLPFPSAPNRARTPGWGRERC